MLHGYVSIFIKITSQEHSQSRVRSTYFLLNIFGFNINKQYIFYKSEFKEKGTTKDTTFIFFFNC